MTTMSSTPVYHSSIMDANMVEKISIGGISTFDNTDSFVKDEPVIVYCSEKKYPVHIKIECRENLFFSKYDLDVSLDGYKVGRLKHGDTRNFLLNLPAGSYSLQLTSVDDSEVLGKMTLKIPNETNFVCKAWCWSGKVSMVLSFDKAVPEGEKTSEKNESADVLDDEKSGVETGSGYDLAYMIIGNSYDTYMLIDTDKKVVLHYTSNDTSILKGKYKGNFNDGARVTWHGGGETWGEILHWHYVNQDSAMILVDRNGFDTKFLKCDVESAEKAMSGYHMTK